jgi:hypothetical protein
MTTSQEHKPRFGILAVQMGFITGDQLKEALVEQVDDDLLNRKYRVLGTILYDKGWMTMRQVETVLDRLLKITQNEKGHP